MAPADAWMVVELAGPALEQVSDVARAEPRTRVFGLGVWAHIWTPQTSLHFLVLPLTLPMKELLRMLALLGISDGPILALLQASAPLKACSGASAHMRLVAQGYGLQELTWCESQGCSRETCEPSKTLDTYQAPARSALSKVPVNPKPLTPLGRIKHNSVRLVESCRLSSSPSAGMEGPLVIGLQAA